MQKNIERNPGVPTNFYSLLIRDRRDKSPDIAETIEAIHQIVAEDPRFASFHDPMYVARMNGLIMIEENTDTELNQIIAELRNYGSDMADVWQERLNLRKQLGSAWTEEVAKYRALERDIYNLWVKRGVGLIYLGS